MIIIPLVYIYHVITPPVFYTYFRKIILIAMATKVSTKLQKFVLLY